MTIEKKFEEIKSIRYSIKNTFKTLTEKHKEIKDQYKKYIENNKKSELLDSFYFQIKLMDFEYDNADKTYNLIDNRMYCDYYKLFIIVYNFFKVQFKNEKSEMIIKNSKYPVYKDLDQFKKYDFDTVNDIHQDIIRLIDYIHKIIQQNENDIKTHQISVNNGLNIDNYIYNLEYNNNVIINNVSLYKKYLSAYHKYHISFLTNLNNRLNLIYEQLENDVNFVQPLKEKKNVVINKMCVLCSLKEAEYCCNCMNEDKDEYDRFANLRNSIENEEDFEIINTPVTKQPIFLGQVIDKIVDPVIEPIVDPLVEPTVDPVVEPIVEPVVEPIVEPVVEPIVEHVADQVVEPIVEPVVELVAETVSEPVAETVAETVSEPVVEPVTETVTEPVTETLSEPVAETVSDHVLEPVVEPVVEPVTETVSEPVVEPVVEPIVEPLVEPVVEPLTETVSETVVEPLVEPVTETVVDPVVEKVDETVTETVDEPVLEKVDETVVETVSETVVEQVAEPVVEPVVDKDHDPVIEPVVEKNVIISENNKLLEPINEVIEISDTDSDITLDNTTDTTNIEKKINNTPPFFLDLNLHLPNEISHAPNELNNPQKKKKHKKNKK